MEDIFEDMFDEADAVGRVDTGTGKQLSQLVRNLRTVENDIEDAETHLKALKQEKHKLSVENIPALMDEMGVERLDVDGVTVERKMIVAASIPVANKDQAFDWLRDNNLDDIIKNDVVVSFSAGQDNMAGAVIDDLRTQGLDPAQKTHIHPSTLKSWVRQRVEAGKELDFDTFGVFVGNEATIKRS